MSQVIPKHQRLAPAIEGVLRNLLQTQKIDYLAITSRVKEPSSIIEKIKRKSYKRPSSQVTDISGIRIIVFFESEIIRVSELIRAAFEVDEKNSSNKDSNLQVNQTGYRSVHYVCEIGPTRAALPENAGLDGLKFELQVRTVLQHAWAELAHDRNYKFSGKLPSAAERKLFLYAGMLELADRGLDELSQELDEYSEEVEHEVSAGEIALEIDSVNLVKFMYEWADRNDFPLDRLSPKLQFSDLIAELNFFGIWTLEQLNGIIPHNYVSIAKEMNYSTNIYGAVRDWMLVHDWQRFKSDVPHNWIIDNMDLLERYIPEKEKVTFREEFQFIDLQHIEDEFKTFPEQSPDNS